MSRYAWTSLPLGDHSDAVPVTKLELGDWQRRDHAPLAVPDRVQPAEVRGGATDGMDSGAIRGGDIDAHE